MNPLSSLTVQGRGKAATASTFEGRGGHNLRRDLVPEKVKGVPSELTLRRIDNQPVLAEPREEGPEVGQVLLFRGARDEDVIQVDEEEGQVLEH